MNYWAMGEYFLTHITSRAPYRRTSHAARLMYISLVLPPRLRISFLQPVPFPRRGGGDGAVAVHFHLYSAHLVEVDMSQQSGCCIEAGTVSDEACRRDTQCATPSPLYAYLQQFVHSPALAG